MTSMSAVKKIIDGIVREIDLAIHDPGRYPKMCKSEKVALLKGLSMGLAIALWDVGLSECLSENERHARLETLWPEEAIAATQHPEMITEILYWPADGHNFDHLL